MELCPLHVLQLVVLRITLTTIVTIIMSPERTLLNTKYDLGENRTHDTSFFGYIGL